MHIRAASPRLSRVAKASASIGAREAGKRAPPRISAEPAAENIVKQRRIANEEKILKDDSHALAKGEWRVLAPMCTSEDDLTFRRFERSSQASQKTGLSCSGGTDNGDELSTRQLDIDPAKQPSPASLQSQPAKGYLFGRHHHWLPRLASATDSFSEPRCRGGIYLDQPRGKDSIAKFRVFIVHRKQRVA